MGYYEIENLYKDQTILNMKEVYVMEKIHGTSAHVSYKSGRLGFFAGGGAHKPFLEHFDQEDLLKGFEAMEVGDTLVIIYGENYGGKIQGMSATYGKYQSFVLSEHNKQQLLIPPLHGHGYVVMSDEAVFYYQQSCIYKGMKEQFTIKYNDSRFNMWWPVKNPIISQRDETGNLI